MHKFRIFCVLVICLGSLLLCNAVQADAPMKVRLFLQENLDADGRQAPMDPKLAQILAYFERETNMKFEAIILPWKRAQVETLQGNGIIYGFSQSEERLKNYHFSKAVITEKVWAITYGRPKPNFRKVEDLRGKVISIGRGFSHGIEFDRARNVIFTVQEDTASTPARFKKLIAKRSDLMLWPVRQLQTSFEVEDYVNHKLVEDANDPELNGKHFDVSAEPLFYDSVHFATAKGKYLDVIDRIDQAIARGVKDGSLTKVLRGYR